MDDFDQQMRDWAAQNGVRPLHEDTPRCAPSFYSDRQPAEPTNTLVDIDEFERLYALPSPSDGR